MDLIESAKNSAVQEMELFLRNFSYVPEERLDWSPTPTSKSALRIAAHTALYLRRFAWMIRNRELADPDHLEQWIARRDREEIAITTAQQVEMAFREGTQDVISAIDSLSPEDLQIVITSKNGGFVSLKYLITLPAWHTTVHLGQIDFLQTCWDDQKVYVD
jgi:hypothetical protein